MITDMRHQHDATDLLVQRLKRVDAMRCISCGSRSWYAHSNDHTTQYVSAICQQCGLSLNFVVELVLEQRQ